jgi:polysaccharide biosynthesis transport protein
MLVEEPGRRSLSFLSSEVMTSQKDTSEMQEMLRASAESETYAKQGAAATQIDVIAFLAFLWRYKWLLILLPLACLVAGLVVAVTAKPVYTATAMVAMEQNRSDFALVGSTGVFDASQVATELELVESNVMARRVVEYLQHGNSEELLSFLEFSSPPFNPLIAIKDWIKYWSSLLVADSRLGSGPKTEPTDAEEAKLFELSSKVREGVKIFRQGQSYVLAINYSSTDPTAAARLANAYAEAYIGDKLQRRVEQAENGARWLEKKLDQIRIEMNTAALAVQEFKARGDYSLNTSFLQKKEDTTISEKAEPVVTLEELESRALTYRKIFESYLQAYADTLQKQSYPVTEARVISKAYGPAPKTWPKTILILAFAFVAGSVIAIAIALVSDGIIGVTKTSRR